MRAFSCGPGRAEVVWVQLGLSGEKVRDKLTRMKREKRAVVCY